MFKKSIKPFLINLLVISLMMLGFSSQLQAQDEAKVDFKTDYVSLGSPMVLNLSSKRSRLTFLQISADMLVTSQDAKEAAEIFTPLFRHILILNLSEKDAKEVKNPETREVLRAQISAQMIKAMTELTDATNIKEVLFSQFLVQ